ncbi:MAG: hypothetical protein KAR16_11150 [Bacteroidales bacterium]|nr:hypothetical protein [Bacteroidales bacterium]
MITRNALISILILMAGLITGYFASRSTDGFPIISFHERELSELPGTASALDTASYGFYGSSVELSHIYYDSKSNFREVVDGGIRAVKEASLQRDLLLHSRDTATTNLEEYDRLISSLEYRIELLRLLDYYTNYFMHYYRWIDTGDMQSSTSYKLAMGQFRATVVYHQEKYQAYPNPPGMDLEELLTGTRVAGQTDRAVRWARVVTVILLFILIMGIPRFIRDRGYRKFAGSLYFDALFRPHKVSDMNAWHSIPRLAMALLILFLFGGVIISSFTSWLVPVVLGSLGLLPVVFLTMVMGNRRKSAEIVVSLMAPKVLIMIVVMGVVAVRGPMFFWYHFWVSSLFRALFLSVFVMLIFHKFHVNMVLAHKWSHRNRKGAAAMVWMALSIQLLVTGILLQWFGLEESLIALNNDLLLLPGRGHDNTGITTWLGVTPELPGRIILFAGIVLGIFLLVFIFNRKRFIHSATLRKA